MFAMADYNCIAKYFMKFSVFHQDPHIPINIGEKSQRNCFSNELLVGGEICETVLLMETVFHI